MLLKLFKIYLITLILYLNSPLVGSAFAIERDYTYISSKYNLSVTYPMNWKVSEDIKGVRGILIYSPSKNPRFCPNVLIYACDLDSSVDFNTFSISCINQAKTFAGNSNIASTSFTFINHPAYKVTFIKGNKKYMQVGTTFNGRQYFAGYAAEKGDYDKYKTEANGIINSINLYNDQPKQEVDIKGQKFSLDGLSDQQKFTLFIAKFFAERKWALLIMILLPGLFVMLLIGLIPPLILRYYIFKRPLLKIWAIILSAIIFCVDFFLFTILSYFYPGPLAVIFLSISYAVLTKPSKANIT